MALYPQRPCTLTIVDNRGRRVICQIEDVTVEHNDSLGADLTCTFGGTLAELVDSLRVTEPDAEPLLPGQTERMKRCGITPITHGVDPAQPGADQSVVVSVPVMPAGNALYIGYEEKFREMEIEEFGDEDEADSEDEEIDEDDDDADTEPAHPGEHYDADTGAMRVRFGHAIHVDVSGEAAPPGPCPNHFPSPISGRCYDCGKP